MRHLEFPGVEDFDPDPPGLPVSFNKFLWSCLFLFDFTFGLTTKPDSEGDVVRKSKYPGATGRLYNWCNERLFRDVEKHLGHLDLEAPTPVPSVDAADWGHRRFSEWRKRANSPLVIRGLLKDSRAVGEWTKEWLVEKHGAAPTRCIDTSETPHRRDKSDVGENVSLHNVSLRDFLLEDRYAGFYINNFHGVFSDDDFLEYCSGERIDELRGAERVVVQWFISRSSATGTPLHCANADNIFLNLKGRKEWHFFHPTFTPVMLPALSRFAVYGVSEIGEFGADNYEDRYREFPHLALLPKMVCLLEEGDVLYNPPWWWHNVQNRTPFNVGCATRYVAHATNLRNAPQFHICQAIDAFKHPLRSVIPRSLGIQLFKRDRSRMIDSIFSGRDGS